MRCFEETGLKPKAFALALCEAYERCVPGHARTMPLTVIPSDVGTDDFNKLLDARKTYIKNLWDVDSHRHVPLEIVRPWCEALPAPYGDELRRRLVQHLGCQGVELMTSHSAADDIRGISPILDRVGKVAQAYAPLIDDAVLDSRDIGKAPAALHAIDDAVAALISLRALIEDRTQLKAVA